MRFVTEFVGAFVYGVYRTRGAVEAVEADAERMKAILDEGGVTVDDLLRAL